MSAKQYPFIDVAVHERVRLPFARGEAVVLFAKDMSRVLWSNGRGAAVFGEENIYDFLDAGPDRSDVAFRQLSATARQVQAPGDRRSFVMRIGSGFRSVPVTATLEAITIRPGDEAILFSAPVATGRQSQGETAAAMLAGEEIVRKPPEETPQPDQRRASVPTSGRVPKSGGAPGALGPQPQPNA